MTFTERSGNGGSGGWFCHRRLRHWGSVTGGLVTGGDTPPPDPVPPPGLTGVGAERLSPALPLSCPGETVPSPLRLKIEEALFGLLFISSCAFLLASSCCFFSLLELSQHIAEIFAQLLHPILRRSSFFLSSSCWRFSASKRTCSSAGSSPAVLSKSFTWPRSSFLPESVFASLISLSSSSLLTFSYPGSL